MKTVPNFVRALAKAYETKSAAHVVSASANSRFKNTRTDLEAERGNAACGGAIQAFSCAVRDVVVE